MRNKRRLYVAAVATAAFIVGACNPAPSGPTVGPINFEAPTYTAGDINGQDGWSKTGSYDSEVDTVAASGTDPGDFGLGAQSLRISNAVTSGSFGDHTISRPSAQTSGETGDRGYLETSWTFAGAGNPLAEQEDLVVAASPDNGSGSRISFVQMADCSAGEANTGFKPACTLEGLEVNVWEYDDDIAVPDPVTGKFVRHTIASGLSRSNAHSIKLQTWFFDGADNDVVRVCVNGTTCVDTGSWEDYFRLEETREPDPVDSVLFHTRTSGGACVACSGNGFFIDNFQLKTQNYNGANLKLAGPSQAPEGNAGPSVATYTLTLSQALPFSVTVPFHTDNGTATAPSDFADNDGSVTFAPGQTVKTVDVTINGDTADESHESFTFTAEPPTFSSRSAGAGSDQFVFNANPTNAPLVRSTSIRDEDSTLRVSDAPDTAEPTSGTSPMPFTVTLDNASAVPVTVRVRTFNGSAVAPGDYASRDITLTFNPGQISRTVNVNINADAVPDEGEESLRVNLSSPTNASIADANGFGIITDD